MTNLGRAHVAAIIATLFAAIVIVWLLCVYLVPKLPLQVMLF